MSILELLTSLELGLIYGITAVGIFITFRVIDFPDLTCDGSFVLGAVTSAVLLKAGYNPFIALLCASIFGGLAGIWTGILHIFCKMTNLLSGILVAFMLYAVNLKIMHGVPNIALLNVVTIFGEHGSLLTIFLVCALLWLIVSFIFVTDFGLGMISLGQNKRLAVNCGVAVSKITMIALALSNAMIGLSGALFSQHQGFADVSQGFGTIIVALAAVMIGEKLLPMRSVWVSIAACFAGSVAYRLIVAFALHSEWLGLQTQDLNLITGFLVVIIMLLPPIRFRRQRA